jgi:tRNA 2-thiouridine synthesizing protein D
MDMQKTLTFVLMDPPFESSRVVTAMRLLHSAVKKGLHVKVFAYEGAVNLALTSQKQHANSVHGRDIADENHPLTKDWVAALIQLAGQSGGSLEWVNCGLCADERGAMEVVPGVRRGSPADLKKFSDESNNTLVIPTR